LKFLFWPIEYSQRIQYFSFTTFLSSNFLLFFVKIFNISENNIIGVKAAKVLCYGNQIEVWGNICFGDKRRATLMPHSLKKLKVWWVCILKAFAGLEYFTFSQWRTAQWDWTLEEPASQTPVMCGGGGGLQLVLFQPIFMVHG